MDTPDQSQSPVEMKQPTDHDQTPLQVPAPAPDLRWVSRLDSPRVLSQHQLFLPASTGLPSYWSPVIHKLPAHLLPP